MRRSWKIRLVAVLGLFGSASVAHAQSDERGVGVADRPRPLYDPIGFNLGSFRLYPAITAQVDATDNYRARDTDRQGDVFATILPEVAFASNWGRHRLSGRTYFNRGFHAQLPTENASQYGVALDGALEVTRDTVLRADASAARSVESRSSLGSFRNSIEPVSLDTYRFSVGASHQFTRLRLDGSFGLRNVNFNDVTGLNGVIINQQFRDVQTLTETLSGQYDVGGGIGILVTGRANQSRFDFRPGAVGFNPLVNVDRASSGFSLEGGVSLELSSLVFGTIQVGYLRQSYRDPRLRDFTGLSFNANVLWNVTPLTSLRFRASRSVDETSSALIAGNTRSDFSVGVDHELYRFLILSGNLRYAAFRPNGPGDGGQEFGVGVSARYLIDRHWSAGLNASYARRDSASPFLRFNAATVGIVTRFAF